MLLESIRYNYSQYQLKEWSLLKVTGNDRESFFQGQVTNDLTSLSNYEGQLTARLNRVGKVQSFFFISKLPECLLILCPKELSSSIKTDFEKFIIMDDVLIETQSDELWLRFNYFLDDDFNKEEVSIYFDFNFYGINARFVQGKKSDIDLTNEHELEEVRILNGWPKWGIDVGESNFVNDSYLNEIAISYKKGCFLGQETVAKIENNRGAAYYPMLLELNPAIDLSNFIKSDFKIFQNEEAKKAGVILYQVKNMIQVSLLRDFRVIGKELRIQIENQYFNTIVRDLPYFKNYSKKDIALELYHFGVEAFQSNNIDRAMDFMKKGISFNPALADAYETLGVMLGRVNRFEEAIDWMNQLQKVDPKSVMAHTNKSLFLMKLGKIEEAEAEKSLATVKSFAVFGEEAKIKRQLTDEQKKKEEESLRREKMFEQVLEIDEEDTIALFGMGDIFFQRKEYDKSIINLKKVILIDPKYSSAYLLLGKAYEAILDTKNAITTYEAGIIIASKRGDMMPANEMQSRLNQLVMSPGLI